MSYLIWYYFFSYSNLFSFIFGRNILIIFPTLKMGLIFEKHCYGIKVNVKTGKQLKTMRKI